MSCVTPSRQAAYKALLAVIKDNAFSPLALDSALKASLSPKDRSLVTALVYGSIEKKILIDYNLNLYLNKPASALKPQVYSSLLLGAYQILFMNSIPASAAVNQSVEIIKSENFAFFASLANAVLRRVSENGLKYPADETDEGVAIKYSFPLWLFKKWEKNYGRDCALALMDSSGKPAPVTIRLNTLRATPESLKEALRLDNALAENIDGFENAFNLKTSGPIEELSAYKQGLFHVQDLASAFLAKAVEPRENEIIFDLCSSPGGKAFTIAQQMNNKGKILAFDLYQSRVDLIASGKKRLGLDIIDPRLGDATIYNEYFGKADRVLCDVPCSGLGVIRRKPEIRFKTGDEIKNLPPLQLKILETGAKYVKDGGRLIYSTCALNPSENEKVCDSFLSKNPDFRKAEFLPGVTGHTNAHDYLTLMPHINNTDGFFIACFEKN